MNVQVGEVVGKKVPIALTTLVGLYAGLTKGDADGCNFVGSVEGIFTNEESPKLASVIVLCGFEVGAEIACKISQKSILNCFTDFIENWDYRTWIQPIKLRMREFDRFQKTPHFY